MRNLLSNQNMSKMPRSYSISLLSPSLPPSIYFRDLKPSCITVIEGSSSIVPDSLLRLCADSVIFRNRDAIFVDGGNSFNPYVISNVAKSLDVQPRKLLSRIHVVRAFTEYQMDTLIDGLQDAIGHGNLGVLAISYLPSLFSSSDGRKLFEPLLERLKSMTAFSDIISVVTSFGGSWYGDRLLAAKADRVVRIEHPSNKFIRIIDNGNVTDYMPVPSGQMRFTDFTERHAYGLK